MGASDIRRTFIGVFIPTILGSTFGAPYDRKPCMAALAIYTGYCETRSSVLRQLTRDADTFDRVAVPRSGGVTEGFGFGVGFRV